MISHHNIISISQKLFGVMWLFVLRLFFTFFAQTQFHGCFGKTTITDRLFLGFLGLTLIFGDPTNLEAFSFFPLDGKFRPVVVNPPVNGENTIFGLAWSSRGSGHDSEALPECVWLLQGSDSCDHRLSGGRGQTVAQRAWGGGAMTVSPLTKF